MNQVHAVMKEAESRWKSKLELNDVGSKQLFNHPDKHEYDLDIKDKATTAMGLSGASIGDIEDKTGFTYTHLLKILHGDTHVSKEDYKKFFDACNNF